MNKWSSLLLLAILGLTTTEALAKPDQRYYEFNCDNGNVAWCVVEYWSGEPTHVTGRNCNGEMYSYSVPCAPRVTNPMTDTTTSGTTCDPSATWYAQIVFDSQKAFSWTGGKNCSGGFYEASSQSIQPIDPHDSGAKTPATPRTRRRTTIIE